MDRPDRLPNGADLSSASDENGSLRAASRSSDLLRVLRASVSSTDATNESEGRYLLRSDITGSICPINVVRRSTSQLPEDSRQTLAQEVRAGQTDPLTRWSGRDRSDTLVFCKGGQQCPPKGNALRLRLDARKRNGAHSTAA